MEVFVIKKIPFKDAKTFIESQGFTVRSTSMTNTKEKLDVLCPNNHEIKKSYNEFYIGKNSCKKCNEEKRLVDKLNEIKVFFKEYDCTLLTDKYINNLQILEFICKCGKVGHKSLGNFKKTPCCKECGYDIISEKKKVYTYEDINNKFNDLGCILISKNFKDIKSRVDYVCINGHKANATIDNILHNNHGRCKQCHTDSVSGENNYNWNGGYNDESIRLRKTFEFKNFRVSVFKRDNHTCQCCKQKSKELNAHHLDGWNWAIDKRFDVINGVTLCKACHNRFHGIYGYGDNTREQFLEFVREDGEVIPQRIGLQIV